MAIHQHLTFHAAVGFLLSQEGLIAQQHVYTITDTETLSQGVYATALEDLNAQLPPEPLSAALASVLVDLRFSKDRTAIYALGSEAHYGYILAHYSSNSEVLSFHTFM